MSPRPSHWAALRYLLVGSYGGVFTFGATRFYGSLPGYRQPRARHPGHPASSTGRGYILVGADGDAFNFGTGAKFHGSLPGEGVKVSDIVGIALTPDNGGYYVAGTDGHAYGFGDAHPFGEPSALASNLPVALTMAEVMSQGRRSTPLRGRDQSPAHSA